MAKPEQNEVSLRRVAVASMAGTILEWYDFFLYAFTAALVFGKLFFPGYSSIAGTMASFGTLAVGFVARPLGGMLFGHFGDRIGRKAALISTLSIMGGASVLIGLIPSYDSIGIWAPIILTFLRFMQGIGLGGEWGGAVLMTLEYSPQNRRGFYGAVVQLGAPIGLALATLILVFGAKVAGADAFVTWGWRVPFLASFALLIVGIYIRLNVSETPAFKKVQESGQIVKLPVGEVLGKNLKAVLATTLLYLGGTTVPFYTVWVFLTYYATSVVKLDRTDLLITVVIVNLICLPITLLGGFLADKFGRRSIFFLGITVIAILAFPLFSMVSAGDMRIVGLAMLLFGGTQWFVWGVTASYFFEYFPANVGYTGISIGSQAATIIGGLVPLFATSVLPTQGTWPVSALVIVSAVLAGIAVLWLAPRGDTVAAKR